MAAALQSVMMASLSQKPPGWSSGLHQIQVLRAAIIWIDRTHGSCGAGCLVLDLGQPAERVEPVAGLLADAGTCCRPLVHGLGHPLWLLRWPHAHPVH